MLFPQSLGNTPSLVDDRSNTRGEECISRVSVTVFFNDFSHEYGQSLSSHPLEYLCWASMISKLMVKYAVCSTALLRRFESLFVLFLWIDCRVKWLGFLKQKIYTPFSLYYPSTPPVIGAHWRAQSLGCHFSCTVYIRVQTTSTPSRFHKP